MNNCKNFYHLTSLVIIRNSLAILSIFGICSRYNDFVLIEYYLECTYEEKIVLFGQDL